MLEDANRIFRCLAVVFFAGENHARDIAMPTHEVS